LLLDMGGKKHVRFVDEQESDAAPVDRPSVSVTPLVPLALVGFSGVLFSIQGAVLKLAYARGADTFEVVTVRGSVQLVGVLLTMVTMHCRGTHPLPVRHWLGKTSVQRRWLIGRALIGYCGIAFGFACYERLPLGDGSALQFVSPVVSVLVAWLLLGEGLRCMEMVAILGTAVGIVLVARPSFLGFDAATHGSADSLGVALALLSALSAGVVIVVVRKLAKELHWTVVLLWQAVGQAAVSPFMALALGRQWLMPDAPLFGIMIGGGIAAFGGQICMTKGLSRARVGPVSAMRSSNVLCAFIWQHLITPDEPIYALSVVGALVITCSIVLILLKRSKPKAPRQSDGSTVTAPDPTECATPVGQRHRQACSMSSCSMSAELTPGSGTRMLGTATRSAVDVELGPKQVQDVSLSRIY
jgi:drug/metabolite transporter (DMT)-like permease